MKKYIFLVITTFLLCLMTACKNDNLMTGTSILPETDAILVSVDTISLKSKMLLAQPINTTPDSLLLGETDDKLGTLHADILTQLACPEGFQYPNNATLDSVVVFLFYDSYYGNGNSPLAINAYELDINTLDYKQTFQSDIQISDYCSLHDSTLLLTEPVVVVPSHPLDSLDSGAAFVRLRTTDQFAQRFFNKRQFDSQIDYNNQFKGLYLQSQFGGDNVLHISDINLAVYYSYQYRKLGSEQDTTVHTMKAFYANSEVRRINHITLPDREAKFSQLFAVNDSISYIASPARINTQLALPTTDLMDQIKSAIGEKRPYINRALLRIDVLNVYRGSTAEITRDDWAQPAPYMMLAKKDMIDNILNSDTTINNRYAIISSLQTGTDLEGNTVYYYSYDLANMLTDQLRDISNADTLTLMPVDVETASSNYGTYFSKAKPQQTISTTIIRSAQNDSLPMRLEITYTGM